MQAQEIIAAAGAEATARIAAESAKRALDAKPEDESLKTAYATAQTAATEAKSKLDGLSQVTVDPEKKKSADKIKRKMAYLKADLEKLGVSTDDEDEDDGEIDPLEIDPDKPLTMRDMQRMERQKSFKDAEAMVNSITDAPSRDAVKAALRRIVPSGDSQKDFTDAVAIANREKNSKILEEIQRKGTPPQHRSGAGSPGPEPESEFVPTAEEAKMMKGFNLTKEQVLAARQATEAQRK